MKRRLLLVFIMLLMPAALFAAEKSWTGLDSTDDWSDGGNWLPQSPPSVVDDIFINTKDAAARISQTFETKSLTVGGNEASTLTIDEFVTGSVNPGSGSRVAVFNRRDGVIVIKGSGGKVTLKGQYKESEENLAKQPSLVLRLK